MGDRDRHFNQTKLFHERPRKLVTFSHAAAKFAPGWSHLLKMHPKKQPGLYRLFNPRGRRQ